MIFLWLQKTCDVKGDLNIALITGNQLNPRKVALPIKAIVLEKITYFLDDTSEQQEVLAEAFCCMQ